jgi:uncharacterized protein
MKRMVCAWLALALLNGACGPASTVRAQDVFTDPLVFPLAEAVTRGDGQRVAKLTAEGVDVNVRGDKGINLLQWALLHRSKAGLAALLDAGANPAQADDAGTTVVHLAAMANDPAYLEILLARGTDPNTSNGVTGKASLVAAMMSERAEQFGMLLKAGADPGHVDRMGNTPAHDAAKINEPWRVLTLLVEGAPPEARNRQGMTFQTYLFQTPDKVLSDEARRGRIAVVEWLRSHDVPVEWDARVGQEASATPVATAAPATHGLFRVGRTGINCYREPCPWVGIVPANADGSASTPWPVYSGPNPPPMTGDASDLSRIEQAWAEQGCVLVEGRLGRPPVTFEVIRVLGDC